MQASQGDLRPRVATVEATLKAIDDATKAGTLQGVDSELLSTVCHAALTSGPFLQALIAIIAALLNKMVGDSGIVAELTPEGYIETRKVSNATERHEMMVAHGVIHLK